VCDAEYGAVRRPLKSGAVRVAGGAEWLRQQIKGRCVRTTAEGERPQRTEASEGNSATQRSSNASGQSVCGTERQRDITRCAGARD